MTTTNTAAIFLEHRDASSLDDAYNRAVAAAREVPDIYLHGDRKPFTDFSAITLIVAAVVAVAVGLLALTAVLAGIVGLWRVMW